MTGTDDAKPWPEECTFGYTRTTIRLVRDGEAYRWIREDGKWVSPGFTTKQAAFYMIGHIPFMTDDEWLEKEVPEQPSAFMQYNPSYPKQGKEL